MSRENIHQKIDELLGLLSIHNNRLSLHTEKISHLDIDVLRKQCIELYDEVNKLAISGKLITNESTPVPAIEKKPEPKPAPIQEPVAQEVAEEEVVEEKVAPPAQEVKPEPKKEVEQPASKKEKKKAKKKPEEEMLSLFEKFSSKPIDSISKAISIAKRFEFQSEFFDGDAKAYKGFIEALDSAGDREASFEIYQNYKTELKWDNEDLKDELKVLLYRKYA